jgi:hypothetical protein
MQAYITATKIKVASLIIWKSCSQKLTGAVCAGHVNKYLQNS